MRKVNRIVLAVVAVCLLAAPLALGQGGNPPASTKQSGQTSGKGMTAAEQTGKSGDVEQTIKGLTERLNQASLKGDPDPYDKLLSDDYISISVYGTARTKPEVLEPYKSGKIKWEAIDVLDMKVRVYGDTALVNYTAKVKGHLGATDLSGLERAVRVWIKRKGQWQCVSWQATHIAQQP